MTTPSKAEGVHVVFGTGQVGRLLIERLVADGYHVRAVSRSGLGAPPPPGVEVVRGDARDPAFAQAAAEGARVVYHTMNAPYDARAWAEVLPVLQENLVAATARAGARLVVLENLYPYGPPTRGPLTENTRFAAATAKGRVRAELAETLLAAHARGHVRVAVGRASHFVGPGVEQSQVGKASLERLASGRAVQVFGDLDAPHAFSYVHDVAAGLAALGLHPQRAAGRAWHLPVVTTTLRELLAAFAAALGVAPRVARSPDWMMWPVGLFVKPVREMIELRYEWSAPYLVDDAAFCAAFGRQATPLADVARATAAWLRPSSRDGAGPTSAPRREAESPCAGQNETTKLPASCPVL